MNGAIGYRKHEQGQCRSYEQSAHDGSRHSAEHGVEQQRKHTQDCCTRSHGYRHDTADRCFDHRFARIESLLIFDVDLVYQYNGVFDIHTDQSQQAENGEEIERFAQQQ